MATVILSDYNTGAKHIFKDGTLKRVMNDLPDVHTVGAFQKLAIDLSIPDYVLVCLWYEVGKLIRHIQGKTAEKVVDGLEAGKSSS